MYWNDETALLQSALTMSMDDTTSIHDMQDADMSDAAADDPDLQLGEVSGSPFY